MTEIIITKAEFLIELENKIKNEGDDEISPKELKKIIREIYKDAKKKAKADKKKEKLELKEKKARQPTAYNLFMKEKMNELKAEDDKKIIEDPDYIKSSAKEKMVSIGVMWKKMKEFVEDD